MTDFEREDKELAAMMGDKFIDQTVPIAEETEESGCEVNLFSNNSLNISAGKKKCEKVAQDAQWMPTKQRNWMDDLSDCMKTTLLFGGLNVLIWYWEIAGLMDESIALPSMLVCAVLAGLGIGKVMGGKR